MRFVKTNFFVGFILLSVGCSKEKPADAVPPSGTHQIQQEPIQNGETNASGETQTRKKRSEAILKSEQVPINSSLPLIDTEADSTRRTTEQVANRAMSLCVVALKGEGLEQDAIDKLVKDFELEKQFTPHELQFIKDPKPNQSQRIQFAWRYECYWVLLWALGFVDDLERPDKVCDVKRAVTLFSKNGRAGFLNKAKLRPQSELLDAADLIYRYHWATRNARIKKQKAPAGLDSGVVMERHYVLNWLIGYANQNWDDVTTDT